jgi:hypothetical protein
LRAHHNNETQLKRNITLQAIWFQTLFLVTGGASFGRPATTKVVFNRHRLSPLLSGTGILRYITSFTVFRNNPALKEFIFKKKNQSLYFS